MSTIVSSPNGQVPVSPTSHNLWRRLAHGLPNIVVFSVLGWLMYFGHHTGWKLPKFSALQGAAATATDDWCTDHLVPESQCVECHPELFPRAEWTGFCRQHGVAECVLDHPERAQVSGTPQAPSYDVVAALALRPRTENNSRNMLHKKLVQFASADSATKAGVDVDVVQERPMTEFVAANGEVMFDPTRVAHLASRVPGTVAQVYKTLGDNVAAGEVLALIDSSAVGQAKSQLQHAVAQYQLRKSIVGRLREASDNGAVSKKSLLEGETAFQEAQIAFFSARQALANLGFEMPANIETSEPAELAEMIRFLGLPEDIVQVVRRETQSANLIPLRSPFPGVVVTADIVAGEVVTASNQLYTISDPDRMWLLLNVRPDDARYVASGQTVRFRTDENSAEALGKIAWISPAVDEQTRTLHVRVILGNTERRLRDKTFGTAKIVLREEPRAITVPREAIQTTSDATFVFVRDKHYLEAGAPKVFHVRQVRIGARDDGFVELLAGVLPGEVVAVKGSPVLLAQLLRSNLGAGCGCHDHQPQK
ncbi:MAG: efflux RND transporter periplasmic adaptor subunit [Planctomycetes bacterium]|nr:efflux RND transporter periplasmic adaptor subunit [Planctomycetota bacterium]